MSHADAVVAFMRRGEGHCVVNATAGSGKTTTLVRVAQSLPTRERTLCLAFGKGPVEDMKARLPRYVQVKTVHALGRGVLARQLRASNLGLTLQTNKYKRLFKEDLGALQLVAEPEDLKRLLTLLGELVHFARLGLVDTKNEHAVQELMYRYHLTPAPEKLQSHVQPLLRGALRRGMEEALEQGVVDFDDMVYWPFVLKLPCDQYRYVLVDECQDVSQLALEFALRFARRGRCMFVGDPRQAIFGFAGADPGALSRIALRLHATQLSLSVTWRCPRRHVALAQVLAPEISAAPNAVEGEVGFVEASDLVQRVRDGDLVLCRNNAPLVDTCLHLVKSGRRAHVAGRALAENLLELVRRVFPGKRVTKPQETLAKFKEKDAARLEKSLKDHPRKEAVTELQADLLECLGYLVAALTARTTVALAALIETTFQATDPRSTVTCSSVHRAKGSEAERVFILDPELMPASYARGTEALQGEFCVMFVALTRAKQALYFVGPVPSNVPGPWGEVLRIAAQPTTSREVLSLQP